VTSCLVAKGIQGIQLHIECRALWGKPALSAAFCFLQSLPTLPALQQSRYLLRQVVHSDGSIKVKEQKSRWEKKG